MVGLSDFTYLGKLHIRQLQFRSLVSGCLIVIIMKLTSCSISWLVLISSCQLTTLVRYSASLSLPWASVTSLPDAWDSNSLCWYLGYGILSLTASWWATRRSLCRTLNMSPLQLLGLLLKNQKSTSSSSSSVSYFFSSSWWKSLCFVLIRWGLR